MKHNFEKVHGWLMEKHAHQIKFDEEGRSNVTIQHDAWCGMLHGMRCDCQPNLLVGEEQIAYPKEILQNER